MSQQCSECGCQTPLGQPMLHFIGCEHGAVDPVTGEPDPQRMRCSYTARLIDGRIISVPGQLLIEER